MRKAWCKVSLTGDGHRCLTATENNAYLSIDLSLRDDGGAALLAFASETVLVARQSMEIL